MTKPTTSLHWADSPTTLRTEPSEVQKDAGFSADSKLPAQYFNWIAGICGDWITWLNERFHDAYVIPSYGGDCRILGDPDEGLYVKNEGGDFLPIQGGEPIGPYDQEMVPISWCRPAVIGYGSSATRNIGAGASYTIFDWSGDTVEVPAQGISLDIAAGQQFSFPANGVYHVEGFITWGAEVGGAPYSRQFHIQAPLYKKITYTTATGSLSLVRTQHLSFDFKVTDYTTQYLDAGAMHGAAVTDTVTAAGIYLSWVSPIY